MEPERDNDMSEALDNAERAEVFCVIFPLINQCLTLDARTVADDPPKLTVSPPLGSAERRLRQVNQARPHLKHAQELAVLPWTGSIESISGSPVWDLIVRRMLDSGSQSAVPECEAALKELRMWERRSLVAMIRGQGPFQTLWSRSGGGSR